MLEDEGREREVERAALPERRHALLDDAVSEEAPDHAVLALEQVEVRVRVPAAEGHAGHEVMEHEVVEDDDTRRATQRVDDPPVRVWVVADVVEGDVRPARRPLRPPLHDVDVDVRTERGQQERAVVRDPRPLGRHRAEVRDPHERSLSMQRSQVTPWASSFPARP